MLAQEFIVNQTGTITKVHLMIGAQNLRGVVMIWLTERGKYGDFTCTSITPDSTSACDINHDGVFGEVCSVGALCNPQAPGNGGCGTGGVCAAAPVLTNGHLLNESPSHSKNVTGRNGWTTFEFAKPIIVYKYTTYFINAAVVGSPETSQEISWYSGMPFQLTSILLMALDCQTTPNILLPQS